jgi:hypothetical protein
MNSLFKITVKNIKNKAGIIKISETDEPYIKYSNGIIYDKNTGLEWFSGLKKKSVGMNHKNGI